MVVMKELKEYYEKEALEISNHQKLMYHGSSWQKYWHRTRLSNILKIFKDIQPKNFLDVGCAEGYYIKLLTKTSIFKNFQGVGLDIAKNYLLKAKKKKLSLLVLGDAHHLPIRDRCFDLVLCSEVLEHVPNPEVTLKELIRVSKKYILITVAGENLFYHLAKKFGLIQPKDPFAEPGHGHIHEMRIHQTVIPWALNVNCKCLKVIISCYFPISFIQKHRIPIFFLPIIKYADKILTKLPVIKEYGAVQIVLLQKEST